MLIIHTVYLTYEFQLVTSIRDWMLFVECITATIACIFRTGTCSIYKHYISNGTNGATTFDCHWGKTESWIANSRGVSSNVIENTIDNDENDACCCSFWWRVWRYQKDNQNPWISEIWLFIWTFCRISALYVHCL